MKCKLRTWSAFLTLSWLLTILFVESTVAAKTQENSPPAATVDADAEKQDSAPVQQPINENKPTDVQLGDDISAITDLSMLQEKWSEIDKQLDDAQARFQTATAAADQDIIRKEYEDLIDRANEIIAQINQVALKEFKNEPNNKVAARLLLGIMMNDAEFGRASNVMNLGDELIKAGIQLNYFETAAKIDRLSIFSKELFEELQTRLREANAADLPRVKIVTSKGDIIVELFENEAPNTVANFINLVEKKFYNGIKFHRVIEGFMAQGGDPNGDGSGGPGYTIKCECFVPDARRHFNGSLSMAHAGKDTGGSQFFLTFKRTTALDGKHTVFGRIIQGMDVLNSLTRTYDATSNQPLPGTEPDVIQSMEVIRKRNHDYTPAKVGDPEKQPQPPPAQPDQAKTDANSPDKQESSDAKKDDLDPDKSDDASSDKAKSDDGESGDRKLDDSKSGDESSEPSDDNSGGGSTGTENE